MKKKLLVFLASICSVGSVFSMNLNDFFESKNIKFEIGSVINQIDQEIQFKRNNNTLVTVPANDSVQSRSSVLPFQRRFGNFPDYVTVWDSRFDITNTLTDVNGSLVITLIVRDGQITEIKGQMSFLGIAGASFGEFRYRPNKKELSFNSRFTINLIIRGPDEESSITISPIQMSGMKGPR